MKWHFVVGLLVAVLLNEAFAGRKSFKFGKDGSRSRSPSPRNDGTTHRPVSTAVVPYNPQTSRFTSVSSPNRNRFQPLPLPSTSSLPRDRSPLPLPSGDRWERLGNKRSKETPGAVKSQKTTFKSSAKKHPAHQPNPFNQPSTSAGPSAPRPPSQSPLRPHSPHPPTVQQPINLPHNPVPSTAKNPGPGPSSSASFQPPVPASLVQAGLSARQQAKAAKAQAKALKIKKSQDKKDKASQVTNLEGMKYPNAEAVKCSNPEAPPESCFDFYVLAVSWGPVARVIRLGSAPHLEEKIRPEWTLHGLWPSLESFNRVPESCNLNIRWSAPEIRSIHTKLKKKWFTTYSRYRLDQDFWQHEWDKHGRCAARSRFIDKNILSYFKMGLGLFDKANVQEKLRRADITAGTTLSIKEMRNAISSALGKRVNLQHIVNRELDVTYLLEIMICYDMHFQPMDCPTHHKYYNNDIKDKTMILVPDLVPEHKIIWEDPTESK